MTIGGLSAEAHQRDVVDERPIAGKPPARVLDDPRCVRDVEAAPGIAAPIQ